MIGGTIGFVPCTPRAASFLPSAFGGGLRAGGAFAPYLPR